MEQNNVWMIDDNLGDSILMEEAILRTSLDVNLTYIDNAQGHCKDSKNQVLTYIPIY